MPIVELYIGEEAILEFEIGYQNLLDSYLAGINETTEDRPVTPIAPASKNLQQS